MTFAPQQHFEVVVFFVVVVEISVHTDSTGQQLRVSIALIWSPAGSLELQRIEWGSHRLQHLVSPLFCFKYFHVAEWSRKTTLSASQEEQNERCLQFVAPACLGISAWFLRFSSQRKASCRISSIWVHMYYWMFNVGHTPTTTQFSCSQSHNIYGGFFVRQLNWLSTCYQTSLLILVYKKLCL